jgi:hypothetical protein
MAAEGFATSFLVEQDADAVFQAITNVPGWWTGEVNGRSAAVGDEFTYRYQDLHYSKQQLTEVVPGTRVAWRVQDAHLTFAADPAEWVGTDITFDIVPVDHGTEVRFAHRGLVSDLSCYDNCSSGWEFFINGSLRRLIATGAGPTPPPWA